MLGTMDIKDAFLQVPRRLRIALTNLRRQRIGAKAWFDFSTFLAEKRESKHAG